MAAHQRFGSVLGILGTRARDLGALMTCGTESRVSRESNAVSMTSGLGLVVSLRPREIAPTRPHATALSRGPIGRILEICNNRLHDVFAYAEKDWDAKFQLNRRTLTWGRNGGPVGPTAFWVDFGDFWGLEPGTLGR
jgi:hypothetical protein